MWQFLSVTPFGFPCVPGDSGDAHYREQMSNWHIAVDIPTVFLRVMRSLFRFERANKIRYNKYIFL